jgi:plasmid stability protein
MADLLIRRLDPEVKEQLSKSAHSNGRSLPDEATFRLKRSLATDAGLKQPAGQQLRAIIDGFELTPDE